MVDSDGSPATSEPRTRGAVLHRDLILLRAPDDKTLDRLLARFEVRTYLVMRLGPQEALLSSRAAPTLSGLVHTQPIVFFRYRADSPDPAASPGA